MKVGIAADHAGYALKQGLVPSLRSPGLELEDLGTHSSEPVDYPDVAACLARAVLSGAVDRGVLICGSGIGASVAANKLPGIRAGLCHDTYSAHQGVEHDDMNILVLGARVIGLELARELVRAFVGARFTHEERHERRLRKIEALEEEARRHASDGPS
jgi:ribose 5-phosphate isomerase B